MGEGPSGLRLLSQACVSNSAFVVLTLKGVGPFLPFLQSPWKLGPGLLSYPLLRSTDWEEVQD